MTKKLRTIRAVTREAAQRRYDCKVTISKNGMIYIHGIFSTKKQAYAHIDDIWVSLNRHGNLANVYNRDVFIGTVNPFVS